MLRKRSRRAYVCRTNRSRAGQCLGCLRVVGTYVRFFLRVTSKNAFQVYIPHVRTYACTRASAALPRERSTRDVRERSRMISAKLAAYSHRRDFNARAWCVRFFFLKKFEKTTFFYLEECSDSLLNESYLLRKKMKSGKWLIKQKKKDGEER